ncbi:hypothetical protein DPMN_172098 [Dreissena polymorpha]|uniref:Uncharacterized protein n=1 Tax=Dreissena polymorpha TaxID=45954 RepID=A0A9D4E2H0_DREPO|nr:hypothetical protein DPMN_172098 [Dreissena polymorpha]
MIYQKASFPTGGRAVEWAGERAGERACGVGAACGQAGGRAGGCPAGGRAVGRAGGRTDKPRTCFLYNVTFLLGAIGNGAAALDVREHGNQATFSGTGIKVGIAVLSAWVRTFEAAVTYYLKKPVDELERRVSMAATGMILIHLGVAVVVNDDDEEEKEEEEEEEEEDDDDDGGGSSDDDDDDDDFDKDNEI